MCVCVLYPAQLNIVIIPVDKHAMPCRRLIGCQTDARGVSCIRRQAISAFRSHEPDHNRDNDMCAHESRNDLKALYLPVVTAMADRWAEGKILNPDSGRANGYYRMTGWLLNYVAEHHALPKGVHEMPEGRDRHGRTEPSFAVDFDRVAEGFSLPE